MFPYFLGLTVILPIGLSLFFLLNRNNLLHRIAAFLVISIFFLCAVWALLLGKGSYQPAYQFSAGLNYFFSAGNVAAILGLGGWGLRRKNWMQGSLAVAQGGVLGWVMWHYGSMASPGSFVLDHLSGLMLLLIDGVGALILLNALKALETRDRRRSLGNNRQSLFFSGACLLLGSMNGLVLSNQLLWMLFFWQAVLLSAFWLIDHERTPISLKNAKNFMNVGSVGSVSFLAGVVLAASHAGTLLISELLLFKEATLLMPSLACFVVAGLVSSAQFPFQNSLFRVTASPAPVLGLLQSSSTVVAGVYLILRLSPLFMNTLLAQILAVIGAFSFAAAILLAAMQHDDKRILTMTTISSMGLVIALACFPALQAIYAAILLAVVHGISKALLFLGSGSRSHSPVSAFLSLLGGASMLVPPFGAPMAQWTAMEAAVRNPVALGLIIAGCVFSMIVWARYVVKHVSAAISVGPKMKMNLLLHASQVILALGITVLSIFIIPFANYFVMPVLKENYGRFDDIAQGTVGSLLLQNFSGVNPMQLFAGLAVTFCVVWFGTFAWRKEEEIPVIYLEQTEDEPKPENTAEAADWLTEMGEKDNQEDELEITAEKIEVVETIIESETIQAKAETLVMAPDSKDRTQDEWHETGAIEADDATVAPASMNEVFDESVPIQTVVPRCSVFGLFPDAKKTHLYASVVAGALIILMLEVVFR